MPGVAKLQKEEPQQAICPEARDQSLTSRCKRASLESNGRLACAEGEGVCDQTSSKSMTFLSSQ